MLQWQNERRASPSDDERLGLLAYKIEQLYNEQRVIQEKLDTLKALNETAIDKTEDNARKIATLEAGLHEHEQRAEPTLAAAEAVVGTKWLLQLLLAGALALFAWIQAWPAIKEWLGWGSSGP